MSIPDPELTFEEAVEIQAAVSHLCEIAMRYRENAVLRSGIEKLFQSGVTYQIANPGSGERLIEQMKAFKRLREEDE